MPFCYEQTSPLARRNMRCIIHSKLKFTAHSLRCFSSSQKPLVFGSPVFLYAFGFSLSVLHAFFLARRGTLPPFCGFAMRSRSRGALYVLCANTAHSCAWHNHITRSGAQKPQNKTAASPPTHVGCKFHSCETVLRGAGKSESPRFWFF